MHGDPKATDRDPGERTRGDPGDLGDGWVPIVSRGNAQPGRGVRQVRKDPELRLQQTGTMPVDAGEALELPASGLELGGPVSAQQRPVTLAGRQAFAVGDEAAGFHELWVHPVRAFGGLGVMLDGAPTLAQRVRVSPVGVLRQLAGGVEERAFVPADAPGAVLEWRATKACRLALRFTVDLMPMRPYPPGSPGSLSWNVQGKTLLVEAEDGTAAAFLAAAAEAVEWRIAMDEELTEDDAAGVTVTGGAEAGGRRTSGLLAELSARLGSGGALRLTTVVAPTPREGARPAETASGSGGGASRGSAGLNQGVAALADVGALVAGRMAASRRRRLGRLAITTPEPGVADAVEWAKYRLASYLAVAPGVGRGLVGGYGRSSAFDPGRPGRAWYFGCDAAWTALACLAVGDFDAAADTIRLLGRHQDPLGRVFHECTTSGLARYHADGATALYLLLVARYLAWTGDGAAIIRERDHIMAAYDHVVSGDPEDARHGPDNRDSTLAELRIVAEALGDAAWAAELAGYAKRASGAGPFTGWPSCMAFAQGRPEKGMELWRNALDSLSHHGRGAWTLDETEPHRDTCDDAALATATAVAPLVYGMLGAEPDAPRHRLGLTPQLPRAWHDFEVHDLRLADNLVSLAYESRSAWHTFRLRQERGSYPLTIAFQPALPGVALREALVDGRGARLEALRFGRRLRVPVQLVLDREREVALRMDETPEPEPGHGT